MKRARDLMRTAVTTLDPSTPLPRVAQLLWASDLDGICVVEDGELVGTITEMELVYRQRSVHLPSMVAIADVVLPLLTKPQLEKLPQMKSLQDLVAGDIMSGEPRTVRPDTPLADVAEKLIRYGLSMVPVTDDAGLLLGIVTRRSLIRDAYDLS